MARAGLRLVALAAALVAAAGPASAGDLAIVVLGAGTRSGGTLGVRTAARLEAALELARRMPDAAIVVTGGAVTSEVAEGPAMADWLAARGVPRERIAVERRARHTGENADFVVPILRRLGAERVVLVTDRNHVVRARYHLRAAVREQGLAVAVDPAPVADGLAGGRRIRRAIIERRKLVRDRLWRLRHRTIPRARRAVRN